MSILSRLQSGASRLAGVALGVGLVAGLLGGVPSPALAQTPDRAPSAAHAVEGGGPALWVIRDADSTIYLFGTVHVLRPETAWLSPRVEAAFESADAVWFEISNPDDQAAIVPLIQQHGLSPDRPLTSLISTDQLNQLQAASQSIGLSAVQMSPMRPWLAALTLSVAPLVEAGYDPNSGVELVLRRRAIEAGKPVDGLETIDQQVGFLAGFSEPAQLAFLKSTLDAFRDAPVELDALVEAWSRGDVAQVEALGVDEMRESGTEVYRVLLADRNADWAGQIQTMLDGSGVVFIAVGAAHLAGPDSVQAQLTRLGVTVETAP